jgi:hypothetical protein
MALQEARFLATLGSTHGALLANLAVVQPFSTMLLLAQLRVITGSRLSPCVPSILRCFPSEPAQICRKTLKHQKSNRAFFFGDSQRSDVAGEVEDAFIEQPFRPFCRFGGNCETLRSYHGKRKQVGFTLAPDSFLEE